MRIGSIGVGVLCLVFAGCVKDSTRRGGAEMGPPSGSDMGTTTCEQGNEDTVAQCSDGCTNDNDAYKDCEDSSCCGVVTCGADTYCGRRQNSDMGSTATCDSDAGTGMENTLPLCSDGCSNDSDTYADCDDRDCCGVRTDCAPTTYCGRQGARDGGSSTCTEGEENTVSACSDSCSNDGDTYSDCEDRDCCGVVECGASTYCGRQSGRDGGTSTRDAAAMCTTSGPENTVDACSDSCSNDSDSYVDCEDRDCCGVVSCGPSTYCGRQDGGTTTPRDASVDARAPRDAAMACTTVAVENTNATCNDGCDNDPDGFADCEDRDCCGLIVGCGPSTYCGARDAGIVAICEIEAAEDNETACQDECSNDGDRFIDCDDSDCCGVVTCGPTTYCGRQDGGA